MTAIELKLLMREVAQVVKRPDVGPLLAKVGAEAPLGDDDTVPKRKRITAALIATDHREPDRGWVERLRAAVDAYDETEYVAGLSASRSTLWSSTGFVRWRRASRPGPVTTVTSQLTLA